MTDLVAARLQMAVSLGFHILFAVAGIAMPWFMVIAEWRYRRTHDEVFRDLAHRWARGTAILFAVGAVSGTVLSFELGLLWPTFMAHAGPLIGMPFSMEGFAFFLEAIGLGVYLYGWDRVGPRVHLGSGVIVALSGLMSGVFVVAVNAWMNTPRGFRLEKGQFTDVSLWHAFFTPAFPTQALHMAIAAYSSVGFAVLGIHAWRLLRDPESRFHAAAVGVVLPVVLVSAPLQVLSGDRSAKQVAAYQPVKLAAAEALFRTTRGAPLTIGGLPDPETQTVSGAIEVPKALSVLAAGDPNATVQGLEATARSDWPPVRIVHAAFQVMVGAGFAMLGVALWGGVLLVRKRLLHRTRAFLVAATLAAPLGMIAVEAGWTVTEVGRQPWIIVGVMRVREAVTPMPGLWASCTIVSAVYAMLGIVVTVLLYRHVIAVAKSGDGA